MAKLKNFLGIKRSTEEEETEVAGAEQNPAMMTTEHAEDREHDINILADEDGSKEQKLQQQAEKEVQQ